MERGFVECLQRRCHFFIWRRRCDTAVLMANLASCLAYLVNNFSFHKWPFRNLFVCRYRHTVELCSACNYLSRHSPMGGSSSEKLCCHVQICPGLNANEMHVPYDRHHEVSSLIKVHQNTPNSVKYEVIWKCQITQSNMKYVLNNTCVQSWT